MRFRYVGGNEPPVNAYGLEFPDREPLDVEEDFKFFQKLKNNPDFEAVRGAPKKNQKKAEPK